MGFNGSDEFADVWDMLFPVELTAVALDTTSRFSTSFSATTTAGSAVLTGITSTASIQRGMVLTGTGIGASPATTITALTSTTITMSQTATASGTVTVTAAMYLYDWKEKAYDATTGALVDVVGGRAGAYALEPAVELSNQQVTVPAYVWGRYRSSPQGEQVFEFAAPTTGSSNTASTQQIIMMLEDADAPEAMMIPGGPGPVGQMGPTGQGVPGLDGDEGPEPMMIPGGPGPVGQMGPPGMGVPGLDGDEGPEPMMIPGGPGPVGEMGPTGMGVPGLDGDPGEDGMIIGITSPSSSSSSTVAGSVLDGLFTGTTPSKVYYSNAWSVSLVGTVSQPNTEIWAMPIIPFRGITIDELAVYCVNNGTGANVHLGIYDATSCPGNLYPKNLLFDSGSVALTTAGNLVTTAVSPAVTLTAGKIYYLACIFSSTGGFIAQELITSKPAILGYDFTALASQVSRQYWKVTGQTFGALPNPYPGAGTMVGTGPHAIFLHCSA